MERFSNFGSSKFHSIKFQLMIAIMVLNFSALIILCVSLADESQTPSVLKTTSWTIGKYYGEATVWYGLRAFGEFGSSLNYASCGGDDYVDHYLHCSECEGAGQTAVSTTAIAFFTCIVQIVVSFLRMRQNADLTFYKLFAILTSLVGLFCLVIAMATWQVQCVNTLSTEFLDYVLGPGFSCALAAFSAMCLTCVLHLLTPVSGTATAYAETAYADTAK
jgi:hypothetical protein